MGEEVDLRKPLSRLTSIVALSLLAILLLAQPVLAYLYRAPLTIVESSSNAYTMLPVRVAASNTWMASNGFMTSTALDTRVQTLGGANRPWMVADDKTLTATAVPADSQVNLYFVTGEAAATSMNIITGDGGYVTTTDAAALEPGATSLELEWQGYFDAGETGEIICKNSVCMDASPAGTIRAYVYAGSSTEILRPNAAGDATGIAAQNPGAGAHWDKVDDVATDENATYVYTSNIAYQEDDYNLTDTNLLSGIQVVTAVDVTTLISANSGALDACVTAGVRLGGVNTTGAEHCTDSALPYVAFTDAGLARPGGGAWAIADLNSLQSVLQLKNTTGVNTTKATQQYVTIHYDGVQTILTAPTTSGIRKAKFTKNAGVDLELLIATCTTESSCTAYASQDTDTASGATVVDTSGNWVSMKSGPAPWSTFAKITINGTLIAWYQPITIINTTVLPDRQGAAQNGAITWGSNPAGVAVTLGSMTSSGTQSIGATATVTPRDILPPVTVSDWFGDGTVSGKALINPMRPMVTAVSDETTLSEIQVWRLAGIIFWLAVTVWTGRALKHHYGLTAIVSGVAVGALVAFDHNIFPMWLLVITAGCFAGGIIAERSPVL